MARALLWGTILVVPDARDRNAPNPWLMLQPPVWVPWAWWALLVATVAASAAGDPSPVCTVAQPCQPDVTFPIAVALMGIAAAAVWWAPATAMVAGLGYAGLSILFDPSVPGRYAGVALGAAAVAVLSLLRSLRSRQARLADEVGGAETSAVRDTTASVRSVSTGGWVAMVLPLVGAAGLLLTTVSLLCYQAQTSAEQAHLDRAQQARARVVTSTDGDYRQLFEVQAGPRTGARLPIEVADEHALGSGAQILLDPSDPSWARLVAEPKDDSGWFGWAMLGACAAVWAAVQFAARMRAGRQHPTSARHEVLVTLDGRAEITLAGDKWPVAEVRLGSGEPSAPSRGGSGTAVVRGPVSDGGWVSIHTSAGALPVAGPVRATRRWCGLGPSGTALPAAVTDRLKVPAVAGTWNRAREFGAVLGPVAIATAGCVILVFIGAQAVPAWDAAQGQGVRGSFTVRSEDCGGKGPCRHYGDFRSSDGQYTFTDVEVIGASADVGSSIPTLYEGHGETPDAVYAPSWSGFAETGLYVGIALSMIGGALFRVLGSIASRRRPTGRHGRRQS